MDDREAVLANIPLSKGGERPVHRVAVKTVPTTALWACFQERLEALGGEVRSLEAIDEWKGRAVLDDDVPQSVRAALGDPVADVWDAGAGVTLCDLAVAETGSLLLSAAKGRRRLASLAPPVHIALVRSNDIVASLEEAFERASPNTSVLVSGPSRTADVEGVMVMGVHGPKRLIVVRLPE